MGKVTRSTEGLLSSKGNQSKRKRYRKSTQRLLFKRIKRKWTFKSKVVLKTLYKSDLYFNIQLKKKKKMVESLEGDRREEVSNSTLYISGT